MLKSAARALLVALTALALVGTGVTSASAAGGGGTISGNVDWWSTTVTLYNATTRAVVGTALTTGIGGEENFVFSDLPPGTYVVGFVGNPDTGLHLPGSLPEYWNDSPTFEGADVITITGTEAFTDIDATLSPEPASISGTLADGGGGTAPWNQSAAPEREVVVYTPEGDVVEPSVARIGWNGKYEIWGLPAGEYVVKIGLSFHWPYDFAWTYVGDTPFFADATVLTVAPGVTTVGPLVTLPRAGSLGGTFEDEDGAYLYSLQAAVEAWLKNPATGEFERYASIDTSGASFSFSRLIPGQYRFRFIPQSGSGYAPEWWEDSTYSVNATLIPIHVPVDPYDESYINVVLGPLAAYRLGGVDRYDANVGMSYETFPPSGEPYSIPVLYVASGEKYPDALSAGPAAIANGGGLLLVRYGDIPAVTLEEIERLNPQRIVVVGGPASVSPAVYSQLSGLTGHIERITGSDRYEVSRNLIEQEFACDTSPCLRTIFVATGRNFPDALSAGPAAGHVGGAVLLIDGAQSTLDAPTLDLLDDMGVYRAYIAGGPASVSPAVQSHLNSVLDGPVIRFTGADRYEAAANINSTIFGDATTVFISTGQKFADALAGGPLAGSYDGPLYLAPGNCMPASVALSIVDRNPAELVLLGGPASISEDVLYWLC